MADTLVVERIVDERGGAVGQMQSTVWILRFCGSLCGSLLSAVLLEYAGVSPHALFSVQAAAPLLLIPFIGALYDPDVRDAREAGAVRKRPDGSRPDGSRPDAPPPAGLWRKMRANAADTFATVCDAEFCKPMAFILVVTTLPSTGSAMTNFLLGPLEFSLDELSYLGAIGTVASIFGFYLYQRYMIGSKLNLRAPSSS